MTERTVRNVRPRRNSTRRHFVRASRSRLRESALRPMLFRQNDASGTSLGRCGAACSDVAADRRAAPIVKEHTSICFFYVYAIIPMLRSRRNAVEATFPQAKAYPRWNESGAAVFFYFGLILASLFRTCLINLNWLCGARGFSPLSCYSRGQGVSLGTTALAREPSSSFKERRRVWRRRV